MTVSPFGERHSAWEWYAGYREMINPGKGGLERADEVVPAAIDWIERNGARDGWFLRECLGSSHALPHADGVWEPIRWLPSNSGLMGTTRVSGMPISGSVSC